MPNDSAMNRLLYAILSQKCLKDIDWNKVASHPILANEKITNGHAARMRWSRFKKQQDSSISGIDTTRPRTPRKPRVEKPKSSPGRKHRHPYPKLETSDADDAESIKTEGTGTPDFNLARIKSEYGRGRDGMDRSGSELMTPGPVTPAGYFGRSESPTPSPEQSFGHSMAELDIMTSFGVEEDVYGSYSMSTGLSQDMGSLGMVSGSGLFGELQAPGAWSQGSSGSGVSMGMSGNASGDGVGVCVKREERWEDAYHHHHG